MQKRTGSGKAAAQPESPLGADRRGEGGSPGTGWTFRDKWTFRHGPGGRTSSRRRREARPALPARLATGCTSRRSPRLRAEQRLVPANQQPPSARLPAGTRVPGKGNRGPSPRLCQAPGARQGTAPGRGRGERAGGSEPVPGARRPREEAEPEIGPGRPRGRDAGPRLTCHAPGPTGSAAASPRRRPGPARRSGPAPGFPGGRRLPRGLRPRAATAGPRRPGPRRRRAEAGRPPRRPSPAGR